MKFVIDDKIPYIDGVFEPFGEVDYIKGADISASDIKLADALVTRTRTRCDRESLEGSELKVIATATIGYDHIDVDYCRGRSIEWSNAPGCNSGSVAQYIAAALVFLSNSRDIKLEGKKIGIIGVGNVGAKVAKVAEALGVIPLLNDPPRARVEGDDKFVSLNVIEEEADFITIHTPLNREGCDRTEHLVDSDFFKRLKRVPYIFNSSRGEVIDGAALKRALELKLVSGAVIDCWEHEPNIDLDLLKMVDISTPHIAGYSRDGKANGTEMSVRYISKILKLGIDSWRPLSIEPPVGGADIEIDGIDSISIEESVKQAILKTYSINEDNLRLKSSVETFEVQRGDYPVRREFSAYRVTNRSISLELRSRLESLGFKCEESC